MVGLELLQHAFLIATAPGWLAGRTNPSKSIIPCSFVCCGSTISCSASRCPIWSIKQGVIGPTREAMYPVLRYGRERAIPTVIQVAITDVICTIYNPPSTIPFVVVAAGVGAGCSSGPNPISKPATPLLCFTVGMSFSQEIAGPSAGIEAAQEN